jgi:hypothetical protein
MLWNHETKRRKGTYKENNNFTFKEKDYKVMYHLATGGSGDVWFGRKVSEDGSLSTMTILKILHEDQQSEVLKEVELIQSIGHENINSILGVFHMDSRDTKCVVLSPSW